MTTLMGQHERLAGTVRDGLFLIAHDDLPGLWRRYHPRISPSVLGAGLAGAALVDLVLADQVCVKDQRVAVYADRVLLPDGQDPIAEEIIDRLASGGWHGLRDVIAALRPGLYDRTAAQLIERKVLYAHARRAGRVKFWPANDTHASGARHEPRRRVRTITKGWPVPDFGTDALCLLIGALHIEDALYLELATDDVTRRIESIGHWLGDEAEFDHRLAAIPAITAAVDAVMGDLAVAVYR